MAVIAVILAKIREKFTKTLTAFGGLDPCPPFFLAAALDDGPPSFDDGVEVVIPLLLLLDGAGGAASAAASLLEQHPIVPEKVPGLVVNRTIETKEQSIDRCCCVACLCEEWCECDVVGCRAGKKSANRFDLDLVTKMKVQEIFGRQYLMHFGCAINR